MAALNRRRFLKRGALFVPVTFGIARADIVMPGPIMRTIAASSGGSGPTFNAFIENSSDTNATTITATGTLNIASGDLVLCFVGAGEDLASTSVAVGGQAMTRLSEIKAGDAYYTTGLYYLQNASANATASAVATFSTSVPYRSISAANWSGAATSSVNDGGAWLPTSYTGNPNTNTTNRSGTDITTTNANDLLVGWFINWSASNTTTAAASWTRRSNATSLMGMCERFVTSTGTYPSGNFATVSSADYYISVVSAWKSA